MLSLMENSWNLNTLTLEKNNSGYIKYDCNDDFAGSTESTETGYNY